MKRIELKYHKRGIWLQILIIIFLSLLMAYVYGYIPGKSCTIITAVYDEDVFYGNSEDQHNPDPVIGFFPASEEKYGSVHFGTRSEDGQVNFIDYAILADNWLLEGDDIKNKDADLNYDGIVDERDLAILALFWLWPW